MLILAAALPTFVCSVLSFLASTTFAFFYVLYPPERHFRQALIVNLLVADWINSLNNSISGAIAISRAHVTGPALTAGHLCTANGYIGQFSVQAIDFNILVISISVLLTVRQPRFVIEPPWWQMVCVCAMPWIPPIITANIALGLRIYGPVSGNWCWIKAEYTALRYALTHGWRIAIFISTIGIYTYIYIYLIRAYGRLGIDSSIAAGTADQRAVNRLAASDDKLALSDIPRKETAHIRVRSSIVTTYERDEEPLRPKGSAISEEEGEASSVGTKTRGVHQQPSRYDSVDDTARIGFANEHGAGNAATLIVSSAARQRKQAVRKMLLLNGYPILYVILWIPGMATRIWEAFGVAPMWLRGLQASTQLVGLANAVTYAYNEQLLQRVRDSRRARF